MILFLCVVRSDLYKKLCCLYSNQTLNHLFCLCRIMDMCSYKYGPVAQTGRALPLQGRGPGFKSRWVHFYSYVIIFAMIFICAAPFRCGLCVKE